MQSTLGRSTAFSMTDIESATHTAVYMQDYNLTFTPAQHVGCGGHIC